MQNKIKINEIFYSIQGEGPNTGLATTFIRLSGCPLRCHYCDTDYAFYQGKWLSIEDVMTTVKSLGCHRLLVTGGEPLAQILCIRLLEKLCDEQYEVSLETSGSIDASKVDTRVMRVFDIKTPGSGEADKNHWPNFSALRQQDVIKFVICSQDDYQWSIQTIQNKKLPAKHIYFSPSYHELSATTLAEWMLQDKLPFRLQSQLHKQLWGEEAGK
jgi:7-carboxy-7-deazaguanine synthase